MNPTARERPMPDKFSLEELFRKKRQKGFIRRHLARGRILSQGGQASEMSIYLVHQSLYAIP
ncbi:hypothetical protein T05_7920 [Trichinella murrelli]|uniref:Uncharacterized protein n=1 Tax=Trichinella murrelli TaxID=144512 RepID=A0A0V0TDC6_9BILA|nr:hypothetical protein T05_7920 [Trichinella murrelli]